MPLSGADKEVIAATWSKVSGKSAAIGADAFARLLTVYSQTKTYFSHFADLSPGSANVKGHGAKIIDAIAKAATNINNIEGSLKVLSELHAYNLRVDPVNFKLLAHCILVSLSISLGADFTPEAHLAWDKFLCEVADVLSEKYR
ncbi:hemoglobin subunit pi-like [Erpetoichthys calabaricus]|uniref:hemoglobin subunit pi-like n=1 Tax=Erpetoichthys calabaricus TaxID=27687 RepID=UPI0010A05037|nr:hemoglobin subunit pi-like [Erpetoichthys calabaricus]